MIQQIYFKLYNQKNWKQSLEDIFVHPCHSGSSILNSHKRKAPQVSIDGWIYKQNVWFMYNEILFGLKKEGYSDACYRMDKPLEHYAKWNEPVTKWINTIWIYFYDIPRVLRFMETETRMVVTKDWKEGQWELLNGHRISFYNMARGLVALQCEYT